MSEHGLEGVVAKRRDSIYQPGKRSGLWAKHRINLGQEFVIGGYPPLMKAFQTSNSVKSEIQQLSSGIGVPEGVNIASVHAEAGEGVPISRTTTGRAALIQGAQRAALEMARLLDDDPEPLSRIFDVLEKH